LHPRRIEQLGGSGGSPVAKADGTLLTDGAGGHLTQLRELRGKCLHATPQLLPARGDLVPLERPLDGEHQLLLVQRLGEVVRGAQPKRVEHDFLLGVRGEDDDTEQGVGLAQATEDIESVHSRHLDVENDDTQTGLLRPFERLLATLGRDAGMTGRRQGVADRLAEEPLVVHDQHARRRLAHRLVLLGRPRGSPP
jgi:hypothetical protein